MPEDLKVSQIGSSPLPPPIRGLNSPGVRKHCQIIFACYFPKSSIDESTVTTDQQARPVQRPSFTSAEDNRKQQDFIMYACGPVTKDRGA